MRITQAIKPFPDNLNRERFAMWLTGFSDGEACFYLGCNSGYSYGKRYTTPTARFDITLRDDDLETMLLIQSFFGFGSVYLYTGGKRKDITVYHVSRMDDLLKVVSHFDQYPLIAKKGNDFQVWKMGVQLVKQVRSLGSKGRTIKWEPHLRHQFDVISGALKSIRAYQKTPLVKSLQQSS